MTSPMLTVKRPRCEYRVDCLGIAERPPGLRWTRHWEVQGETQSTYRTPVALNEDVEPEEIRHWGGGGEPYRSVGVKNGDELLRSGSRFTWMMPLLGRTGNSSPSSVSAGFETGLLERSEWKGALVSAGVGPEFSGRMARG